MTKYLNATLRRKGVSILAGGTSVLALMSAAPAWAQSTVDESAETQSAPADAPETESRRLTEVVVTAQRRDQSLQDVPISVSAISDEALAERGIRTTADLNVLVPSMNAQRISGANAVFLRAVGSNSRAPMLEPPVAFYVDGVYYAGALSSSSSFSNVERIEVLKGPQGTLFGRNSMGGLVNVITSDPTDELTGHVKVGYGNYDTFEGDAYISGPIATNLAADFSIYGYDQAEGWGENLTVGGDANFRNRIARPCKLICYSGLE